MVTIEIEGEDRLRFEGLLHEWQRMDHGPGIEIGSSYQSGDSPTPGKLIYHGLSAGLTAFLRLRGFTDFRVV